MLTISAVSRQYVQAAVTGTVQGSPYNPTADPVKFAFIVGPDNPTSGQWVSGSWDGTTARPDGSYRAQCLIGPGGTTTLTAGTYTMWIQITDNPEIPVINVGLLTIT